MIIDNKLLDELKIKAETSPILRFGYDLRTTPADNSQRMLNAMEPGTVVPIHRHMNTSETVVVIRGKVKWVIYNDKGTVIEDVLLDANGDVRALCVPQGQWHIAEVLESGTVIIEAKGGPWTPISKEDTLLLTTTNNNRL